MPFFISNRATVSSSSGRNRISCARERIVGSCRSALVPIKISTERGGGSFERLQQCVGPFLIQVIGIVDDGDFPPAGKWLQADLVAQSFVHPMFLVADQQRQPE